MEKFTFIDNYAPAEAQYIQKKINISVITRKRKVDEFHPNFHELRPLFKAVCNLTWSIGRSLVFAYFILYLLHRFDPFNAFYF